MSNNQVMAALNAKFNIPYETLEVIHHETTIPIAVHQLHDIVILLQTSLHITHLTTITAQVHAEHADEIRIYYHFWHGEGLTLAVVLPTTAPTVPSIVDLIPGADFYEREVAEMFGVQFMGRKATPRLLLPDDWSEEPPMLRKEEEAHE
jgi:NADH:ubiquinone oxidoreductase subunit C